MKLFHGTSSKKLSIIKKDGLLNPFLTNDIKLAEYYADLTSEMDESSPVILEVEVNKNFLVYDKAAMDEPVLVPEKQRDQAWEKAAREHPEWVKNGFICIPKNAWEYSLVGVHSVQYRGIIPANKIKNKDPSILSKKYTGAPSVDSYPVTTSILRSGIEIDTSGMWTKKKSARNFTMHSLDTKTSTSKSWAKRSTSNQLPNFAIVLTRSSPTKKFWKRLGTCPNPSDRKSITTAALSPTLKNFEVRADSLGGPGYGLSQPSPHQNGSDTPVREDSLPAGAPMAIHEMNRRGVEVKEALMIRPYYLDMKTQTPKKQYPTLSAILAAEAKEERTLEEAEKAQGMEKLGIASPEEFAVKFKGKLQELAEEHGIGDAIAYSFRSRKIELIGSDAILLLDYDMNALYTRPMYPVDVDGMIELDEEDLESEETEETEETETEETEEPEAEETEEAESAVHAGMNLSPDEPFDDETSAEEFNEWLHKLRQVWESYEGKPVPHFGKADEDGGANYRKDWANLVQAMEKFLIAYYG
jgi:hypothetical protein